MTGSSRTQKHLHVAHVDLLQLKWSRILVAGAPHKHSFVRDGDDKRFTSVVVSDAAAGKGVARHATVTSGVRDLLVLKTTESSFENYVVDKYTTLKRASPATSTSRPMCRVGRDCD